jgi:hypothetical protein
MASGSRKENASEQESKTGSHSIRIDAQLNASLTMPDLYPIDP